MIIQTKYFVEKTNEDYKEYNILWEENREKMIYYQAHLPLKQRLELLSEHINNNSSILSVRFATPNQLGIMFRIIKNGITLANNNIWYPTEIWIYN